MGRLKRFAKAAPLACTTPARPARATLQLRSGTIQGGTILPGAPTARLVVTGGVVGGGTLDGVTNLAANVVFEAASLVAWQRRESAARPEDNVVDYQERLRRAGGTRG